MMLRSWGELESEKSVPVTVRTPATESEMTMEVNVQVSMADWQTAVNGPISTKLLTPMTKVVFFPDGADAGDTYVTVARRSFLKRTGNVATHVGHTESVACVYRSENDTTF